MAPWGYPTGPTMRFGRRRHDGLAAAGCAEDHRRRQAVDEGIGISRGSCAPALASWRAQGGSVSRSPSATNMSPEARNIPGCGLPAMPRADGHSDPARIDQAEDVGTPETGESADTTQGG